MNIKPIFNAIRPFEVKLNSNKKFVAENANTPYQNNLTSMPSITPNFKGMAEVNRLQVANRSLTIINKKLENKDLKLTDKDKDWVNQLNQTFGTKTFEIPNPKNPKERINVNAELTINSINEAENGLENLKNSLKTMVSATLYKPVKKKVGTTELTIHNKNIANMLKPQYDSESFDKIKTYLDKNRVFDMTSDPNYGLIIDEKNGLIKTCGASENWEMGDRMWVTDSMRVADIQKIKRPETWAKSLSTVADFYAKEDKNFKKYINNPSLYRDGNPKEGIPHIFLPATLEGDPNWFNNKRLESLGLALKEFSTTIVDGIVKGADYGFKSADKVSQNVLSSIENISEYLRAIGYENAPSAGNWEEIPLKGGLTWDTEAARSGFEALNDLMYNPKYNDNVEIQKIRQRLNVADEKVLAEQVKKGENRVRNTYLAESPGIREADSSLAFITTSNIKLSDNPLDDVKKHIEILDKLEKTLVRENGIIRYAPFSFKLKDGSYGKSPDSYLTKNYFISVDKNGKLNLEWKKILDGFGSKDASEPEVFAARSEFATPDKEAQWFMVSEMSTGYGKQLEKLLEMTKDREPDKEELALINKTKVKQTEYLNRALARISEENPKAKNQYKANGLDVPPVTISEAHQWVSDLNGEDKMVQGTNAPLTWAVASTYKALALQEKIIEKMKK